MKATDPKGVPQVVRYNNQKGIIAFTAQSDGDYEICSSRSPNRDLQRLKFFK